ncbi:hypothetical protein ABTL48_21045, partial [Acinetobacter baumannii]
MTEEEETRTETEISEMTEGQEIIRRKKEESKDPTTGNKVEMEITDHLNNRSNANSKGRNNKAGHRSKDQTT